MVASPIVGCCGDDDRDPRTPTNNGASPIVSANQPHYLIVRINNEVMRLGGGVDIGLLLRSFC
jgi:hypothetical protein